MTPLSHTAGQTLNALIAEKVMGKTNVGCEKDAHHTEFVPHMDGENIRRIRLPHYSTEMAAAWLVVEKMRERHVYIDVETRSESFRAVAGWEGKDGDDIWQQSAAFIGPSAPLVICLAALATVEATS